MIFYTKYDRMNRKSHDSKKSIKEVFTDCGNPIGETYEYKIIDGIKSLVSTGEVNRQELINSFALSHDINVMIMKFLSGDSSVLNPTSGVYGDFTNAPKTYAEVFQRVEDCRKVFDSMPIEIKEKFDNSYEKFWSEFGTDYFNSCFEPIEESEPVQPVKTNDDSEVK